MNTKKIISQLNFFIQANSSVQKSILRAADDSFIQFLGEIALNILEETIELSKYFKTKLRDDAWFIRKLGSAKVKASARRKLCLKHLNLLLVMINAIKNKIKSQYLK